MRSETQEASKPRKKETKQTVEFGDIGETKQNTHKRKTILLENSLRDSSSQFCWLLNPGFKRVTEPVLCWVGEAFQVERLAITFT